MPELRHATVRRTGNRSLVALVTQQARNLHVTLLPTAVRPGAVLEVGDRDDLAG